MREESDKTTPRMPVLLPPRLANLNPFRVAFQPVPAGIAPRKTSRPVRSLRQSVYPWVEVDGSRCS